MVSDIKLKYENKNKKIDLRDEEFIKTSSIQYYTHNSYSSYFEVCDTK